MTTNTSRSRLPTSIVVAILGLLARTVIAGPDYSHLPSIAGGDAAVTLNEWSMKTGLQVLFTTEIVRGVKTNSVGPNLKPKEMLKQMLAGTKLTFRSVNAHTIIITTTPGSRASPEGPMEQVLVRGKQAQDRRVVSDPHLADLTEGSIASSGLSSLQDVLRTYLQFEGGGCDNGLVSPTRESQTNSARGCGVNWRGIGPGGTVVLINGGRPAYGGTAASFGDISQIPLSAVDRIELPSEGSSVLYGGDAIGGVVNFILRREFQGSETQVRMIPGISSRFGGTQLSQTLGHRWDFAAGSASFEYFDRQSLPAADRREGTSDLTSQGGRNYGTVFGKPPTVAVGSTLWAPEVQNAKLPTAYSKGTVNLFNSRQGTYLLPHQRRASIYLAGDLDFSPTSQLFSDALVTKRWIKDKSAALGLPLTITKVSPWYWNPTGGTAPIVAYYGFLQELGPETLNNDVLDGNFDVGLKTTMANWAVNLKLGYSTEVQHEVVSGLVNPGALASSLISPERSLAFNPFGVNNASVLQAISSSSKFRSTSGALHANVTARRQFPDTALGDVDITTGIDSRGESFDTLEQAGDYVPAMGTHSSRNVTAVFGKLCILPMGSETHRCREADDEVASSPLQFIAAGRYERYSRFAGKITPTANVRWSPTSQIVFEGNWALSSKKPGLADLNEVHNSSQIIAINSASLPTQVSSALAWSGGNPDLRPETAQAWTLAGVFNSSTVPGLTLRAQYYDIDYRDRIDQPSFGADVLTNAGTLGLLTLDPTLAQRALVCSHSQFSGSAEDCMGAPIGAIVDGRLQNISNLKTNGLDLSIQRTFGRWALGLQGTYILEYVIVEPTGPVDWVNSPGHPIQFRSRGFAEYSRGNIESRISVNYANGYHDFTDEPHRNIRSYTTADLFLTLRIPSESRNSKEYTTFAIGARNVFNSMPPFVNNSIGLGFDPVNAEPLGRVVTFIVIRRT